MPRRPTDPYAEDDFEPGPSKSRVKQEMLDLQDLGTELLALPEARLDEIEMEDQLRDALSAYRAMKTYEARRRQMQLIGKRLRETDPQPFRRAIIAHRQVDRQTLRQVEDWRERLLADDAALTAWIAAHPVSDKRQLRSQIRKARDERAAHRLAHPTDESGPSQGRASRELFRLLHAALQATTLPG